MTDASVSRYNVLSFVDKIKKEDPEMYEKLKTEGMVVHISRTNGYDSEDLKSSYTVCCGAEMRLCGKINLELNELEELLQQDRLRLGEEGITTFIRGGRNRIHSIRRH